MSKLFKTKATLQRVMSIHWKIYHYLQPNFVKIEMLLDICFICIFLTNWFDSILLRSKDLEQIPGLITNAIHWNSQSLRTKYIYSSVYFYDLFFPIEKLRGQSVASLFQCANIKVNTRV